jgi:hypothetical protein
MTIRFPTTNDSSELTLYREFINDRPCASDISLLPPRPVPYSLSSRHQKEQPPSMTLKMGQKEERNIQQRGFASGHPPNY